MATPSISRKKAPRRTVVDVQRVGTYGGVEYVHTLECGHVQRRKRSASTSQMSCTDCVLAEQYVQRSRNEQNPAVDMVDAWATPWNPTDLNVASAEVESASVRASIAAHLGVSRDAVDVVLVDDDGVLSVQYAVVVLSADEVSQLLGRNI